jgi:pantoate--beta-alanine ligase
MEVITSLPEMRERSRALNRAGKKIALVPTMGYLHEGHLSLIRRARPLADLLAVSIFVNPAQFGPSEDLRDYPRDLERDLEYCRAEKADIVFHPSPEDVYPPGFSTYVEETRLSRGLCGAARPGHFRGVATVVLKLFNLVRPDVAVFGEKDYQQFRVISKMVEDLNLPIRIVGCPIVREEDGLAMSSRNEYLGPEERKQALCLYQSLQEARRLVEGGEKSSARLKAAMEAIIRKNPAARIDYIDFRDAFTLEPREEAGGGTLIALAVFIGRTRLIDNTLIG